MSPTRRRVLAGLSALALAPTARRLMPAATAQPAPPAPRRPNVLMIAVDDLSPRLGCYGDAAAVTPNLDRLAARGTRFERAYCQMAVCGASRASLLTGFRPDATGVNRNAEYTAPFVERFARDHPTIPTWFSRHGHLARVGGKVHHSDQNAIERLSGPPLAEKRGPFTDYPTPAHAALPDDSNERPIAEALDVPDDAYKDGVLAGSAARAIADYAAGDRDRPLFLGVGFQKPHLPHTAPKRYWDLHDPDAIPLSPALDRPAGSEPWMQASYELANRYAGHLTRDTPVTDAIARRLRHGYYACASYADAQIGRVLDALDTAGLAESTLVVLWADHGFHLGDQGMWGKHANYEVATRVPLLLAGPGVPAGRAVDAVVESLSIYRTLCDYAGLAPPADVGGASLCGLIDGDAPAPDAPEAAAFCQYPRGPAVGRGVRTADWRYVEWRATKPDPVAPGVAADGVRARELYDHRADPHETANVAADHADVVARLSARIAEQFGPAAGT